MYVYQEKAHERIRKGLPRLTKLVKKGIEAKYKEADTRKLVEEMFTLLGWDRFDNITAEQMINSSYADYVVKTDTDELFVVEVKQVTMNLRKEHLTQAKQYAVDEGIEYIVLTNANDWLVYKVVFDDKIPYTKLLFQVSLSDADVPVADKTKLLYLLSEEANRSKEIDAYYEYTCALSSDNLITLILSENVINRMRIDLKSSTGQSLKNSELAQIVLERVVATDKVTDEHLKAIQKLKRSEK